jgi:hypothetical protein
VEPGSTQSLMNELVRDLQPVRRYPSLRVAAGVVIALTLPLFAVTGVRPDLIEITRAWPSFAIVLVGLAIAAIGGIVAGAARSVPGRERAGRGGAALVALGLGAGGISCLVGLMTVGASAGSPSATDLGCLVGAVGLSIVPALAMIYWMAKGSVADATLTAGLGIAGAAALGALLVHLECAGWGPRHILLGHIAGPVVLASMAAAGTAMFLRSFPR